LEELAPPKIRLIAQRVKRRFRLTGTTEFMRVRKFGRTYAHPLLVLIALPNGLEGSRFAVSAGRTVGNAVQRNRAKRILREILRPLILQVKPGWDILLLARRSFVEADFLYAQEIIVSLLQRSHLLEIDHVC
jgi:ribonuclease P protein component